ncbi:MAG: histidinol-phosphate transaminase [Thalassospira sp.]|nr:histidinol-phosphate transaminase [Thalassospira sp.]
MYRMSPQPKPWLSALIPYVGGESTIKPGAAKPIRLTSNEGALGASPKALAAYAAGVSTLHLYPQASCLKLREAIAARYALDAGKIVCGNGSDDLILLLARAYAGIGDEVVVSKHGFSMYKIAAHSVGATVITAPETDYTTDMAALLAAVTPQTRLVFIANPNNPTGTYLNKAQVERLLAALPPGVLLVLDGAYSEFADAADYDDGLRLVEKYNNIIILRTFSKVHALAGLRLGWGYAAPGIIEALNKMRAPFNVSAPAQAAGIAAMEDAAHLAASVAHNTHWRALLTERLTALGYPVLPSQANFLLFETGDKTDAVYQHLCAENVYVRPVKSYDLPRHLRVTVGSAEDNQAFLAALSA